MRIDEVTLEAIKIYSQSLISEHYLDHLDLHLDSYLDHEIRAMVVSLHGYVYGERMHEQVVEKYITVPATWWDAFKLEAIKWGNPFFNPHKVKMKIETIRVKAELLWVYPDLAKLFPVREQFGKATAYIRLSEL